LTPAAFIAPWITRPSCGVALEAEAVLGILAKCESGQITLISSEVLSLEVDQNTQPQGKAYVFSVLQNADAVVIVSEEVRQRARILESRGFRAYDALHVASAEAGKVDFLCTCDDRVLKNHASKPI
jgi:predicted nucleic acid-binding protein